MRQLLEHEFKRVSLIAVEIERFIPETLRGSTALRADLAGFLVVAMASSYENCIKQILVSHAASKHVDFEQFAERNFDRLNSRIQVSDLTKYAGLFDERIRIKFKKNIKDRKKLIQDRTGHSIEDRYHQLLKWRHAYAHAGEKNTTIKEASEFHLYGKRVVYAFADAFR